MKHANALWLVLLLFASCSSFDDHDEEAIARVFDKYLYPSDLQGIVPVGASPEDSVELTRGYIDQWVKETVVLHQAEINLTDQEKDVERQLEEYRRSLIIYAYEKALMDQNLDTSVGIGEIEEYYLMNGKNFELKDYIVKVLYVKVDTATQGREQVEDWYQLKNEEDWPALEEWCAGHAINYYYDTETWLYLDDLVREVPLRIYDKEEFLKENQYLTFDKGGYSYYLNILEYRLKDNTTPLSLEKENIRNIILQQRKRTLIEEMRQDLHQDALDRQNIEIFVENE